MASGFPGSRGSSDRAVGFCLNCRPGYGEHRKGAVREAGQALRESYLGFQVPEWPPVEQNLLVG